ncbi:polysaccharide deacetylase family protein [Methanoplanus limicola]|uniref:Polysaccharide deacetylase n=1 Tax=Methanoplanus limicola DSM 2279 TaxID=937775 RepID=H1YZS0_9EURY|nr:polysaccharide deacetylase family protein [Methanoplanus limicola]EHQ34332.1 hypothetical protein Metlim_0179 [Methanoplanus limicola DSM 2279]
MYSISYTTDDPLRLFAINHFIDKSGIPVTINSKEKKLPAVNYGTKEDSEFSVNILSSDLTEDQRGIIQYKGITFPLWQIPEKTENSNNSIIAEYIAGNRKYPCISEADNSIEIGFDLFMETGNILSGSYERPDDISGKINFPVLRSPAVDYYEDLLINCIIKGCRRLSLPFIRKSYWPYGKKFAVCLTHDVDEFKKTYQWITKPLRALKKGDYLSLKNQIASFYNKIQGKEPYWTFDELMKSEEESGVKSSYYFLRENTRGIIFSPKNWHMLGRSHNLNKPYVRQLIKDLSEAGNEIGVHGSTLSYENPDILKSQKDEIEQISGAEIYGIRQHRLNMNIPKTWECQINAGLMYDTSLGYKSDYGNGFRFGTCFPFYPAGKDMDRINILEMPLSLMDISLPPGDRGWEEVIRIISTVEDLNGLLTALWHPPVFNQLEYPFLGEYYKRLVYLCQQKNAWITTGYDIALWWIQRDKSEVSAVMDGEKIIINSSGENEVFIDLIIPGKSITQFREDSAEIIRSDSGSLSINIIKKISDKEIILEIT